MQPRSDGLPGNIFFCRLRDENDFCAELFIFLNQRYKAFGESPDSVFRKTPRRNSRSGPRNNSHSIFFDRNFNVHHLTDDFWLLSLVQHSRTKIREPRAAAIRLCEALSTHISSRQKKQCQPK